MQQLTLSVIQYVPDVVPVNAPVYQLHVDGK